MALKEEQRACEHREHNNRQQKFFYFSFLFSFYRNIRMHEWLNNDETKEEKKGKHQANNSADRIIILLIPFHSRAHRVVRSEFKTIILIFGFEKQRWRVLIVDRRSFCEMIYIFIEKKIEERHGLIVVLWMTKVCSIWWIIKRHTKNREK